MTRPTYRDITPEERRWMVMAGVWLIVLAIFAWGHQ